MHPRLISRAPSAKQSSRLRLAPAGRGHRRKTAAREEGFVASAGCIWAAGLILGTKSSPEGVRWQNVLIIPLLEIKALWIKENSREHFLSRENQNTQTHVDKCWYTRVPSESKGH